MSDLKVNGVSVGYRVAGGGPTVLLLHSGGSSGAQWREVIQALGESLRTVTVDFHGFGKTDPWPRAPEERTHEADAALALDVLDHAGVGDEPVHVVGHSFGGGVALRLAAGHPERLKSLVLLEPIANSLLEETGDPLAEDLHTRALGFNRLVADGNPEGAWRGFIDFNNGDGAWEAMPTAFRDKMFSLTDAVVSGWHANLSHATTLDELRAFSLPVSALHGDRTLASYRRITEIVAGEITGCSLTILPGAGHMSPLTHPEAVAAAIEIHLRTVI